LGQLIFLHRTKTPGRHQEYGDVFSNRSLTVAALTRTFDPDAKMLEFAKEPRVRAATVKERLPWNTPLNFRKLSTN
jgi:hypothetical protein